MGRPGCSRSRCLDLVQHPLFDAFMLCAIVANSVLLGFADYSQYDPMEGKLETEGSWRNQLIDDAEGYFLGIFTLECVLKIYAMRFCGRGGT